MDSPGSSDEKLSSCDGDLSSVSGDKEDGKTEADARQREYVDGGYGWVIVFSCFLQLLLCDGIINAFGVIYLEVIEKFEANSAEVAWILSTQTCVQGLVGLGVGVLDQVGMSLVNLYFGKRSGLAMGIAIAGSGAGIVIFSPITNYLFSVYGYKVTCYILSAIALCGVVAGAVIVTPEKALEITLKLKICSATDAILSNNVVSHSKDESSDSKIEDGPPAASVTQSTASLVTTRPEGKPAMKKPLVKILRIKLKSACDFSLFRDYKFVLFTLAHILFSGAFLVPSSFMPARPLSYGISKTDASLLVSAMGITNLISPPICGLLIDIGPIKRNRFYLFIFWLALSGTLSLYSFGPTLEAQMTFAIIYGLAQGYIFDVTGRYEDVYYIFSGSVLLLAGLCLAMIPIVEAVKKICQKQPCESK